MARISISDLREKKRSGIPVVMLTCYDYPTALREDQAGVDVQLVGDSVGTNVLGYGSVSEVTVGDMVHHVRAVSRGAQRSFVLCDMPFQSYRTKDQALETARILIGAGADGVKIEGEEAVVDVVGHIVDAGITVCAHIGHTPQTQSKASVQGKDLQRAAQLFSAARKLERAGAALMVLELIPEELAREITSRVSIPTIGIAAGRFCDGQVQVVHDILGLSVRLFRHAKKYADAGVLIGEAVSTYGREVRQRDFPSYENASHLPEGMLAELRRTLGDGD